MNINELTSTLAKLDFMRGQFKVCVEFDRVTYDVVGTALDDASGTVWLRLVKHVENPFKGKKWTDWVPDRGGDKTCVECGIKFGNNEVYMTALTSPLNMHMTCFSTAVESGKYRDR